jgi:hypothetical protein
VTDLAWSPEDRYLASVGLDSQVLIWSGYTLGAPGLLQNNNLLNKERSYCYFKNEYAELISITDLSRVFVGIRLESSWRHSLTIAASKFGAQRIGNLKLKFESLSKTLPGVRFSDDSGEFACS